MKVHNITHSYINSNYKNCTKPVFGSTEGDTFVKSAENMFPLKEITSKTAQLLYGMDYTPQSKPVEGYYLAYALDKKTLKPVDIYIKNSPSNSTYFFYRKNPNGGISLIGTRKFSINDEFKIISPGYMESLDKSLIGVGLLEHQVAVEEMLKRGYKNVKIEAVQSAYDFHTKAGFKSTDSYVYRPDHMLTASVYHWADRLKATERAIRDLLVFKPDSEIPMLNQNKTLENIVLYMKKTGKQIGDDIKIYMELPKPALQEWISIAKAKPILLNTLKEVR